MKKLLIALMGIMMMGMMTSCNESKPVAESQQEEVKVYDPAKMLVRLSVIEVYLLQYALEHIILNVKRAR